MKIAIICDVLGEENNGTTIAAMNLIRSLEKKGHQVTVVCPKMSEENHNYVVVPQLNLGIFNLIVKHNGVCLAKSNKKILKSIIQENDSIHIMLPFFMGCAAVKLAKKYNKSVTAGFHCQAENFTNQILMMNNKLVNHLCYKIFYHNLYKYCNAIHYPTKFICDLFEKECGHSTNHYIISNGVNKIFTEKSIEKKQNDKFIILFTGRYSREKSHIILLKAISKSNYKDKIHLIFAGEGPLEKKIKKTAKKLQIEIPEMNFYSRTQLVDIINSADLYVHPAEIEIEAISCLEAISCGIVPVISDSKRSATRYFALEENNKFKCNDYNDLARKIDYWIEHPKEKEECSKLYNGFSQNFKFENCMDKMESMIIKTAEENSHQLA